jgi:hypothetical protein
MAALAPAWPAYSTTLGAASAGGGHHHELWGLGKLRNSPVELDLPPADLLHLVLRVYCVCPSSEASEELEEDLAANGLRPGGGAYYSYRLGEKKLLHPLSALAISAGW